MASFTPMSLNITQTWYIIAAICGLLLCMSVLSYRRSNLTASPAKKMALVALRVLALAAVLFLLLDPHDVRKETFREKMEFAVLLDASASMKFKHGDETDTRYQHALHFLETEILPTLTSDFEVAKYSFGSELNRTNQLTDKPANDRNSDLASALDEVLVEGREVPLGGVLVVSDGQFDVEETILKAVRKYRKGAIPVFTYCCGTAQEAPDVSIRSIEGGQMVPFEPRVRLAVKLESPGFADQETLLSVKRGDRLLYEKLIKLNGEAQEQIVEFDTPYRGFFPYDVEVESQQNERLAYNNQTKIGLDVQDQKIRVLYMEGTSNSTHTLEDALEQDPDIEVRSLYFPQNFSSFEQAKRFPYQIDQRKRRIYNVSDPERGYPLTLESLLQYDVVINSDIYRDAFTQQQLDATVALVEKYGGGFVMVGGHTAFGAGHYDETVIDKLMPVDCYGARDHTWSNFQLLIPERAFEHPIMQVGDNAEDTKLAWTKHFPGFLGLNMANRPKPGAITLARHDQMKNQYGNLVVFAVQQIGRGRTMAFMSDTTESWGTEFEARWGRDTDATYYYRRFWNNAIRWLAADRIQRKRSELVVRCSAHDAVVDEPITISIPLPEAAPAKNINLRCDFPDGTQELLKTVIDPIEQVLKAEVIPSRIGTHTFTARFQRSDVDVIFAKNLVNVTEDRREESTTKAQPELLKKIASITNAASLNGQSPHLMSQMLGDLGTEFVEFKQTSIWDRMPIMLLLLSVLTGEWFARRKLGFV